MADMAMAEPTIVRHGKSGRGVLKGGTLGLCGLVELRDWPNVAILLISQISRSKEDLLPSSSFSLRKSRLMPAQ